ncbi:ATP phosphoribosyltransferase [Paenibacillus lycopersici]|uniref:ATP phosphoribosyltransferase n=1 Tax=Paenibacillus lycopersici TaxID=2704462 RepID=A0A6C0G0M5_9BACL|nr:ATP phosphoribosyltransferase [Paenibacillus lycopersici]QHT62417.1 ATP phosphoribosyltransferase [Paenibacillus lycopersici]
MKEDAITIAFPKGEPAAAALFRKAGYSLPGDFDDTRNYIIRVEGADVRFILAKPIDIPTYVEYGAADIGIAGKDALLESGRNVCELLDLNIGEACMTMIMKRRQTADRPKVATRYPKTASAYCRGVGQQAEIMKWQGGIELALHTGAADGIFVAVDAGWSCDSFAVKRVCRVSSRLIANRASYQLNYERIERIREELRSGMMRES